jgi:hypothetical protein
MSNSIQRRKTMKTDTLASAIKLISKITHPSSIVPLYRSVEIGSERARACSEAGNIEITIGETGLEQPALLDFTAVQGVLNSLPQSAEMYLSRQGNCVLWETDFASGSWKTVHQEHRIPILTHYTHPWKPPRDFASAVVAAALAVEGATLSAGMYGLLIERTESGLQLLSCNSTSLAAVTVPVADFPAGKITLRPPVPAVLVGILCAHQDITLDVTDGQICVQGDWITAQLPISPQLEHDLFAIADGYSRVRSVVKISRMALVRALKRAISLTPRNERSMVELSLDAGTLVVRHKTTGSSGETVILAEGIDPSTKFLPVEFQTEQLLIPIQHIDSVCLDYLPQRRLVLLGESPDFRFIVSGR